MRCAATAGCLRLGCTVKPDIKPLALPLKSDQRLGSGTTPCGALLCMTLQVVMTALRAKQAELKAVLDKLAALDADLAEKTARKESLEAEVELCKIKLDR